MMDMCCGDEVKGAPSPFLNHMRKFSKQKNKCWEYDDGYVLW